MLATTRMAQGTLKDRKMKNRRNLRRKNPLKTSPDLGLQTQGGDYGEPCNLVEGMKKGIAYQF